MNAFSKNYTPVPLDPTKVKEQAKSEKLSKIRTAQRERALSSADPDKRKAAEGNLGQLSKRTAKK